MNDEPTAPTPSRRFSLPAWLASPALRRITAALLAAGFAILVGVYMHVVNRYVHFSIRVYASGTAEPGGSVALRATLYRPGIRRILSGTAILEHLDPQGVPIETLCSPLDSRRLTPFQLRVPETSSRSERFRLQVTAQEDGEWRTALFELPVGRSPSWLHEGHLPLASGPETWGGISQADEGQPRVQQVRIEPAAAEVDIALVAENGVPVRYLENRFFVRLMNRSGEPLGFQPLAITLGQEERTPMLALTTDGLGLAEFRAIPEEIVVWRVDARVQGEPVSSWFEIVPSWDGLLLRADPPLVGEDQGFQLSLSSHLQTERWYYDVWADEAWMATGSQPMGAERVTVYPPAGTWNVQPDRIRLLVVEVYSDPFTNNPQRSIRGVLVRPQEMSERVAIQEFVQVLRRQGIESNYLAALGRLGLPSPGSSQQSYHRLQHYLLGRAPLAHRPHPLVYDDAQTQTQVLRAEVEAFREKATWVLILGSVALLLWISGRVGISMWQTRRRTREWVAQMVDEDLELESGLTGAFGASAGPAALLWSTLLLSTLAAFLGGIILLLTHM